MELQRADELSCAVSDNRPDEMFILIVTLNFSRVGNKTGQAAFCHY